VIRNVNNLTGADYRHSARCKDAAVDRGEVACLSPERRLLSLSLSLGEAHVRLTVVQGL
jgi:hypothetical protein